ncbi:subunit beta of eukaryotic translation initiation factor 2 [Chloropicon primus]|uniref:Eukaryotic translation initiation factor 2 subunit beta n=1 Tax=Chloropicon primus TaxID=1764295 RepID=A0A5B8MGV9_9CHLO|nr:subunit beta of eukaryotic translation initiation factor 2 [Chloropicon primus]UPQ98898.1 subunit beta of eukaryotic translation initiation factor 2 [Chloropicon primus]|eukprot:QDZ19686.1 subunit beta of eukaryotic translation initiation factor 2 [Chloropicon primus]
MTAEELEEKVEDLLISSSVFGEKKKKKKKKKVKEEDAEDGGEEAGDAEAGAGGEEEANFEADFDLSLKKKKKKKKKKVRTEEDSAALKEELENAEASASASATGSGLPWDGSDRDYTYEELLDRVFGILRKFNPELTGEKRRTVMKPPQVLREGTKKTVFVNFMELCKAMHRQPDHVLNYMMGELGTSGSLDGQQRLIVKGRFLPKAFEGVLRRYVNEYVLCHACKSPDTLLDKDNTTRLYVLSCQHCGARRSVSTMKQGFVAQVGKRKKMVG